MRQAVDVRTPVATGKAKKIGKGLWRKQVLPTGEFQVGGRRLSFTPDYHRAVAQAFQDAAYDTVPTMLADKTNDHTMAVLDEGGEVLALEAEDDGLYATVKLSNAANEKVENNPRLGVSVRIRENYDRSDGKFYPAAMQHLLLTWDPRIAGMKPWEPIDLSNSAADALVIDLSAATYEAPSTTPTNEGEPNMADLTPDELAQVRAALPLLQRLEESGQDVAPPADPPAAVDESDDEEFERIAAEIFGDLDDDDTDPGQDGDQPDDGQDDGQDGQDGQDGGQDGNAPADQTPATVAASNDPAGSGDYLEMSNAARDADRERILELSNQLNAANYEKERDQLVRATGLPPSIIDLARPVLEGSRNVVELSNGSSVDAGEVVRKVLAAVGEKVQLLDLSAAIGTDEPTDEDKVAAERRRQVADDILMHLN
jgi:hypothetical protein